MEMDDILVFTLFWINAAIAYYLTLKAGLEHETVYISVIVALLTIYYLSVFKHWVEFKTIALNQKDAPDQKPVR